MWQDLYFHLISAGNPFYQAWKLFSAEILKILECHFGADVMLRQSRLRASRASPAQKSKSLRVVYSKKFSRATFLVSWVTYLLGRYVFELSTRETNLMKKCSVSSSKRALRSQGTKAHAQPRSSRRSLNLDQCWEY